MAADGGGFVPTSVPPPAAADAAVDAAADAAAGAAQPSSKEPAKEGAGGSDGALQLPAKYAGWKRKQSKKASALCRCSSTIR